MNKKLLASAALASLLLAPNAFADNHEGTYLTVGGIASQLRSEISNETSSSERLSIGLAVGYTVDLGGFFVAPELFADSIRNDTTQGGTKVEIKNRYGVKLNLGTQIQDGLDGYVSVGISGLDYQIGAEEDIQYGAVYGIGTNYELANGHTLNIEYNYQNDDLEDASGAEFDTDLHLVKIGLVFNF